jgi:hypothetical protein
LIAGLDQVHGPVAFGEGEGFEGGGDGDALGDGGGFYLRRGGVRRWGLRGLLGESGAQAEEAEGEMCGADFHGWDEF